MKQHPRIRKSVAKSGLIKDKDKEKTMMVTLDVSLT